MSRSQRDIASFNLKKTKQGNTQAQHNDRTKSPEYLINDDFQVNRNWREATILKNKMISQARQKYTERTGQKFQSKSYEWSAVCNIKPNTTMEDLEKLAQHFQDKYKLQCYQIAIHRDEGNPDKPNDPLEINQHAHFEFITLDKETGRNAFRDIKHNTLRQIQTEVAKILGMERGQDKRLNKTKRIEPRVMAVLHEREKSLEIKYSQEIENLKSQKWNKSRARELFKILAKDLNEKLEICGYNAENFIRIQLFKELDEFTRNLDPEKVDMTAYLQNFDEIVGKFIKNPMLEIKQMMENKSQKNAELRKEIQVLKENTSQINKNGSNLAENQKIDKLQAEIEKSLKNAENDKKEIQELKEQITELHKEKNKAEIQLENLFALFKDPKRANTSLARAIKDAEIKFKQTKEPVSILEIAANVEKYRLQQEKNKQKSQNQGFSR